MSISGIHSSSLRKSSFGQGFVEFALLLPILVFVIYGSLELGRAFFAYIAISNAAREGARTYTFRPDVTTVGDVLNSIHNEVGNVPTVEVSNISSISIQCGIGYTINISLSDPLVKIVCPQYEPIRVELTYSHSTIFSFIFPQTFTLRRSVEMMVP